MKLTLVAHGLIEIPPKGYGAVESLVADYAWAFDMNGHSVQVINERDFEKSVEQANASKADVIWIHDDKRAIVADKFKAPVVAITSHDPTLFDKDNPLLKYMTRGSHKIGCLCQSHYKSFAAAGVDENRLFLCPNGARSDLIRFNPISKEPDTFIFVGIVSKRKGQHLLAAVSNVRFAGDFSIYDPVPDHLALKGNRWLGPWSKQEVHDLLTNYGAGILLSSHEAAPLVVPEYLMAGLPCLLSRAAAVNLPALPFVKVLDDWILKNPTLVHIEADNFMKSVKRFDRVEIRKFSEEHFDWLKLASKLNFNGHN